MRHILFITTIFLLIACQQEKSIKNPNILLIMVDDMGYSDLGFMGSGIETPNIDELYNDGIFLTEFYNTGRCCPSRASLLTGLYSHQTGMGWMTASNLGHPGYTGDLNQHCVTIAEVLKSKGYACYTTGKWHVTHDDNMKPEGPKHNWPLQRGFDEFYGHLTGGGSFFNTRTLVQNNDWIGTAGDNFYVTTAVTDSTLSILKTHFNQTPDKPFFHYLAYYAPHRPLHALPNDIEKFKGKFMMGWDSLRIAKLARLIDLGIADSSTNLAHRDERVPVWDSLTQEQKLIWDARMAVYAAQLYRMDAGVGKILSLLQKEKELDNTLVIFLSDNGASDESQGGKLTLTDLPNLGNAESAQSYREEWAHVSNTPYRLYKKYNHNGGVRTPLIISWPDGITSNKKNIAQRGHIIDILPSLIEITGAEYPSEFNGNEIYPLAGKSFIHTFSGKAEERGPLFFEHEANRAVINGEWKLVSIGKSRPPYTSKWELYNIVDDPAEMNNLANTMPGKVNELALLWDEWANNNKVYPLDGRRWGAKVRADVN